MLPKLTAEQERRRRAFAELHNIIVILSIEIAIAVYLISGSMCRGFTVTWLVSVLAFNYAVVTVWMNRRWFVRKLKGAK